MKISGEHEEQAAIFRWAAMEERNFPELKRLNGSLNGIKLMPWQLGRLKQLGVKKGYPDMFLPVPRGKYHGLFIELKVGKGTLKPEQEAWLRELFDDGYYAAAVWGASTAVDLIYKYLHLKDGEGL